MEAVWLADQTLSFRQEVPIPDPGTGEALIQVRLAGICSTDLELVRGYYPFAGIPGHEFVGSVVSSPGDPSWMDRRVVGDINIACGECDTCKSGLRRHCERRKVLGIHDWNGAFADYLMLPLENLHLVPEGVPDEAAVFTEPLAAAGEILEQVDIKSTDRVLVIGAGKLGQLVAMVLQQTGCLLEVLTRHSKQRELLARLDIQTLLEDDLASRKYDLIIEATGSPDGFELASKLIKPRGVVILKSTYKGDAKVNFSSTVVNEVSLIGSPCGPFEPAMKLMSEGKVYPRMLIDATYPLVQGIAAFEHASRPGALKVLLKPAGR
jgi:threonine dehydrogenase-like Zn-dependent dehydrogenase